MLLLEKQKEEICGACEWTPGRKQRQATEDRFTCPSGHGARVGHWQIPGLALPPEVISVHGTLYPRRRRSQGTRRGSQPGPAVHARHAVPSAADSCRPGEGSGAWPRPGPEPHAGLTRFSSRACCRTRSEAKSELAVFFLHTPTAPVCFSCKLPLAKRTAVDRVGRVTTRAGSDVCCCRQKLKSAISQNLPSRWKEKPLAAVRSCPCLQAAASLGLSAQTVQQGRIGLDCGGRDRRQAGSEALS